MDPRPGRDDIALEDDIVVSRISTFKIIFNFSTNWGRAADLYEAQYEYGPLVSPRTLNVSSKAGRENIRCHLEWFDLTVARSQDSDSVGSTGILFSDNPQS